MRQELERESRRAGTRGMQISNAPSCPEHKFRNENLCVFSHTIIIIIIFDCYCGPPIAHLFADKCVHMAMGLFGFGATVSGAFRCDCEVTLVAAAIAIVGATQRIQ